MAIAFVQSKGQDAGGSGTGTTIDYTSNVTSGNLLIYAVRLGGDTTLTVTSNRTTGSWTQALKSSVQSDDGSVLVLVYAIATSSGACTVTFAFGTAVTSRYAIAEYSGIDTTTPFDKGTSNQSGGATSTTPVTSAAQTPTQAASLVLGMVTTGGDPTSITAGSGYTLREAANASNRFAYEDKILAASSAQTAGFTLGSGQTYIAGLAIFNAAGGGGATGTALPGVGAVTTGGLIASMNPFTNVRIREVLVNEAGSPVANQTGIHLVVWYGGFPSGAADLSYSNMTTDPAGTTSWSLATGTLVYNQRIFYVAHDGHASLSVYTCAQMQPTYS
jgi:hypothetical protein